MPKPKTEFEKLREALTEYIKVMKRLDTMRQHNRRIRNHLLFMGIDPKALIRTGQRALGEEEEW